MLSRLRDLGRSIAMRWPAAAGAVAPEGSRRRALVARLTRSKVVIDDPLVSPLTDEPKASDVSFAAPPEPLVSVVIPVYRKLDLTLRCLAALARADLAETFEVIAVDDASGDGTAEALRRVAGVSVVETPENLGYLRATNTGIDSARGEFVLLLNNDVEVHPQAVRALVDALRRYPNAGAAGARLVYADGSLQEAGGIIWSDGSGWNYGKGGDPRSPEFAHVRPVDYCSAACLLVRRSALENCGGFDERYAPAYYEDSDLAFALRAAGMETIYVPAAIVLHHEGASHGTSVRSGVKAFQQRNRERFCQKWPRELAAQHPASVASVVVARDRRRGPRLLVLADQATATAVGIAESATARDAVVTLVAPHDALPDDQVESLRTSGVEVWPGSAHRLARHVRLLAPHLSAVVVADGTHLPAWFPGKLLGRAPVVDGRDANAVEAIFRDG